MSKLLEYTLSLNDQISGKLQKIGVNSDSAQKVFSKLQAQASESSKVMTEMGKSVGSLQQRLDLLKAERDWIPASAVNSLKAYNNEIRKTERELHKLQGMNGGGFRAMATNAMQQIPGASMAANPLVLGGAALVGITQIGIENEQAAASYEVLLQSADKAKKMLGEMSEYASTTPYGKAELQEAGRLMLSFGVAQEAIMPNMKMLGDVAGGNANKLQSLTLAFSQVQSAGKLQGQDLLQMINAGFNPLQEMAKKLSEESGISKVEAYKKLREQMEKGAISADMVTAAFKSATGAGGIYHGMTEKMGQTIGGKLSTAMDNLKELALKLFEVIGPVLSPALDVLIALFGALQVPLGYLVEKIGAFATALGEGNFAAWTIIAAITAYTIATNAMAIVSALAAVKTAILEGAMWLLNVAMDANPVGLVIAGIVALIGVITWAAVKTEGWASLWEGSVGFMKHSFLAFVEGTKETWYGFTNTILSGLDAIQIGWHKFRAATGMADESTSQSIISKIEKDAAARQQAQIDAQMKAIEHKAKAIESLESIDMRWNSDLSLADVTNSLKKKLGFEVPVLAGTTPTGVEPTTPTNDNISENIDQVTGGGKETKNISITLGKMFENLTIHTSSLDEGLEDAQSKIEDVFLRILNNANSI
jgi:tape measure domain-containing protein